MDLTFLSPPASCPSSAVEITAYARMKNPRKMCSLTATDTYNCRYIYNFPNVFMLYDFAIYKKIALRAILNKSSTLCICCFDTS